MDTATCAFVALRLAPPRAARLVEAQAGGVYERRMAPLVKRDVQAVLATERAASEATMRAVVEEHGADLLKRFDDVRAQARADAEAQIAAARAQLEEQARQMQEAAQAEAARLIEEAKAEGARYLAGQSAAAKSVQATREAMAETSLGAWVLQSLGGNEFLASRVVRYVKSNHEGAWRQALRAMATGDPEGAGGILAPVLGMAQRSLAASQGTPASGGASAGGW